MKRETDSNDSMLLVGARVVLPRGVAEGMSLLTERGRIARISDSAIETVGQATRVINLDHATLFPGFIDVHIHGAVGVDMMEADADQLHRVARFLAQNGVTAWLPTLVPAPIEDYTRAVRVIEELMSNQEERPAAARALGLHYEGPFINSAQCGALRPAYFQTFNDAGELDALAIIDESHATHMITVAPEIEGGIELVRELATRGWIIAIGHTRAGVDVLDQAREAGARHMTHFMNAMSPLHHRSPGPIGWGLLNDDVSCDVIADSVHVDPLILKLILRAKTPTRVSLISDAVAPAGLGDGEYNIWGETISVTKGRTRNARGSIAGSVITMRDAVRTMLSLDVPLEGVARMAASNPARLLGIDQDCGSIEEGKRADLVALDEEGNVRLTLIGGRIAFDALSHSSVDS
ncbi:MAG: N-acetylglucosamine-6-phosphate deacetylase [Acidobacteriota bacterium]|jgi:N-acetylglucosamine-6-phosphate deacetylase|nr:N-acetylglucosamine-6-phosphate deacetylase [Acidobacteriota bacterium]